MLRDSSLEVVFGRDAEQVWTVRQFVKSYYEDLLGDHDLLYSLALAVQELLENATKYSASGKSLLRICFGRAGRTESMRISVTNDADPAELQRLRAVVDELSQPEDTSVIWGRMLRRAQRRRDGSGLGLARLRLEANLALQVELIDNRVCVSATTELPKPVLATENR